MGAAASTTSAARSSWAQCIGDDGPYWYNLVTREYAAEMPPNGCDWVQKGNEEDGSTFWYNVSTDASQWEPPSPDLSPLIEAIMQLQRMATAVIDVTDVTAADLPVATPVWS